MRHQRSVLLVVLFLVATNLVGLAVYLNQPFPLPLEADLYAAAWSPDGSQALLAGESGAVFLFDGHATRALRSSVTVTLRDVEWSPSGDLALLAGDRGTLLLYDAANDALGLLPYDDPAVQFEAVTWIDGDAALIAGSEGRLVRYDPGAGEIVQAFLSGCYTWGPICPDLQGIDWRPQGDYALLVGGGTVFRDAGLRGPEVAEPFSVLLVGSISFSLRDVEWKAPEGDVALIVGDNGLVRRFDGSSFTFIQSPTNVALLAVAWKPFTSTALLAGDDGTLLQYSDFTRRVSKVASATGAPVLGASWNLQSETALLVAEGGILRSYPNLGVDPAVLVPFWFGEVFAGAGAGAALGYGYYRKRQRLKRHVPAEEGFTAAAVLDFEAKHLLYEVRLRNESSVAVGEVRVAPRIARGEFVLAEAEKILPLLRPGDAAAASFVLRPRGEPAGLEVGADVRYYDGEKDAYRTIWVPPTAVDLRLLRLKGEALEKEDWEERVSRYFSVEEHLRLYIPAEEAFQESMDALRGRDLAVIETSTAHGKETFTARASLFARDAKRRGFAVHLEAHGGGPNRVSSTLALRVFAEVEETLFGFYHRVFGDVETRLRGRDESLDIMKRITELTQAIREKEEAPEAAVEITRMRGTLEQAFESLRTRLEKEAAVRSVEELNDVYKDLAHSLMADGTLDPDVGRRRVREQLSAQAYAELVRLPEAMALLAEAESSDALRMAELLPESGRKALLLVYPNALEVYLRDRLKRILPPGVTVLLGAEFGHINTRRKDWEERWRTLSLGSCLHAVDNNQYLFLADRERWEEVTKGMLHDARDMRNVIAHPSEKNPSPDVIRARVYALLEELPRVLKPVR